MTSCFVCIICLIILDILILLWIFRINYYSNIYKSSESNICPVYYCDEIVNPKTGQLQPGSLCYTMATGEDGSTNMMVAYRYTSDDNSTFECQNFGISNHVVPTMTDYLPTQDTSN